MEGNDEICNCTLPCECLNPNYGTLWKIHIYLIQNDSHPYTLIENLDKLGFNVQTTSKQLRKKLCCGSKINDGNIELQGDHRDIVRDFLITKNIVDKKYIIVHGY